MSAVDDEIRAGVRLGYRPELDGLRAVAVAAVVGFHVVEHSIPGGFLGVDLFFVLSGFLITRLLLEEMLQRGRIDLRAFYVRRVARLLPLLVVVVASVFVVSRFTDRFGDKVFSERGALTSLFYVSNWSRVFGYPIGVLGHTWSLSVEEQFYVVWPVVVLVVARRWGAVGVRNAALALGGLAVVNTVVRSLAGVSDGVLYDSTDTRGATLLMAGCALGAGLSVRSLVTPRRRPRWVRASGVSTWPVLGGLVAFSLLVENRERWLYLGGFGLAAMAFAALVVGSLSGGAATQWLSHPLLVWLGRRSYGIYLWHYPVLFLCYPRGTPNFVTSNLFRLAAVSISVGLAAISHVVLEQPLRLAITARYGRRQMVPAAARRAAPRAT